jgi:CO/xanthine dehydrogenase Mo-binding subunit
MSEVVGHPIRRNEDPRLLRGRGEYISDLRVPGMLTAAVVRSSHAHARLLGVDSSAARALPGVVAVYTVSDLGRAQRPIPTFGSIPPELARTLRPEVRSAPVYPLAEERVRYVGEPVALVVANDPYVAADALELVRVGYDPLPPVTDVERACQTSSVARQHRAPDHGRVR